MRKITGKTKLNMVIGNPITHSQSPLLHGLLYEKLRLDTVLLPFTAEKVQVFVPVIRTLAVGLTAVTMPFKQSIISALDRIDTSARAINAVNTIINKNGQLTGYNTDVFGISYALRSVNLKNKNVLLLGSGGAASGVAYVVKRAGGNLMYANRVSGSARLLQKKFGGKIVRLQELEPKNMDLIVNATPVGMYPDTKITPLPPRLLAPHQTIFDLVYNPVRTKLLETAARKGARTISGLDMFVAQGVRQVEIWTAKKIITPKLLTGLKREIIKNL